MFWVTWFTSTTMRDARTDDDQRHPDVAVESGLLAGIEPMLSEVKAVVGGEDDVRVIGQMFRSQRRLGVGNELVHGLDRLRAPSEILVQRGDLDRGQSVGVTRATLVD